MPFSDPFGGGGAPAPAAPAPAEAGATPAPSGGGGFQDPFSGGAAPAPKKSGGGGILGGVAKALSPIGTVLNAGEQTLFHGASALGSAIGGNLHEAGQTLSQIPGAAMGDKSDQMTFLKAAGQEDTKLPFGLHNALNAVGSVAGDPLNVVLPGLGPEARAAHEAIEGGEAAGKIAEGTAAAIRKGGMDAVDQTTKDAIRQRLVETSGQSAKHTAEEIADKKMAALEARGQGGLNVRTLSGGVQHVAGSFDRPGVAKAIGDTFPRLAKLFSPSREEASLAADAAREDAKVEAQRVANNAHIMNAPADQAGRAALSRPFVNDAEQATEQAAKHIGSAKDLAGSMDKAAGVVRSQLLAFPGTVVNRAKRGMSVLMYDGIAPTKLKGAYQDAKALMKGGEVEKTLGLSPNEVDRGVEKVIAKSEREAAAFDKARKAGVPQLNEADAAAKADQAASKAVMREQAAIQAEKDAGQYKKVTGGVSARLAQVSRDARAQAMSAYTQGVQRPLVHDYASGLDQYLKEQGLRGRGTLVGALNKAGIDGEHYLNIRQIVHDAGGNMYRGTDYMRPRILKGSGKLGEAYEAASKPLRTGATQIRKAGTAVENINKTVSAMHNLDRYGNVADATKHVAEVMGDPWKLTHGEKMISPITPFWGAIRNHIETVARTGFDNPGKLAMIEHLIKDTPLGQGSGDPIGSSAKVLDAPASVGLGLAGAAGSAVGHPFAQGQLVAGLKGLGGLSAGAPAAAARLASAPEMLGKAPGKALINATKTALPSVQRLPLPGKKAGWKQQIEKFITGMTMGGG